MYKRKQKSTNHIENPDIVKLLELLLLHIIHCTASTLLFKKLYLKLAQTLLLASLLRNVNNAFLYYGNAWIPNLGSAQSLALLLSIFGLRPTNHPDHRMLQTDCIFNGLIDKFYAGLVTSIE